jgi:hypothetical protein
LAFSYGVVACLKRHRGRVACAPSDQTLIFGFLFRIVIDADGVVMMDDLVYAISGPKNSSSLYYGLERLPVVNTLRPEKLLEKVTDAGEKRRTPNQKDGINVGLIKFMTTVV